MSYSLCYVCAHFYCALASFVAAFCPIKNGLQNCANRLLLFDVVSWLCAVALCFPMVLRFVVPNKLIQQPNRLLVNTESLRLLRTFVDNKQKILGDLLKINMRLFVLVQQR